MIINALFEQTEDNESNPDSTNSVTELLLSLDEQHRKQQASILVRALLGAYVMVLLQTSDSSASTPRYSRLCKFVLQINLVTFQRQHCTIGVADVGDQTKRQGLDARVNVPTWTALSHSHQLGSTQNLRRKRCSLECPRQTSLGAVPGQEVCSAADRTHRNELAAQAQAGEDRRLAEVAAKHEELAAVTQQLHEERAKHLTAETALQRSASTSSVRRTSARSLAVYRPLDPLRLQCTSASSDQPKRPGCYASEHQTSCACQKYPADWT